MYARSYCLTSASTRLRVSHGGLGRRPEKYMLYSASRRLRSTSSCWRPRSISVGSVTRLPERQEPDERQPQLSREWQRPIVDEHLGVVGRFHDREELAELHRVAGPEA